VERAWTRGSKSTIQSRRRHACAQHRGDSGMPQLLLHLGAANDKRVHFEFLDNTVQLGERPRTVAFGSNDAMYVLNVKCMLDVERTAKVNRRPPRPRVSGTTTRSLLQPKGTRILRNASPPFRDRPLPILRRAESTCASNPDSPHGSTAKPLDRAIAGPRHACRTGRRRANGVWSRPARAGPTHLRGPRALRAMHTVARGNDREPTDGGFPTTALRE